MNPRLLLLPSLFFSASCVAPEPKAEPKADCCATELPALEPVNQLQEALPIIATVTPIDRVAELPGSSLYRLDGAWTDQTGSARTLRDFEGEVVVTAMVFTNCQYACPMIMADLKDIEAQIPAPLLPEVRWLLVSMDSDRDTPDVLAAYAEANQLDTNRWTLLHGEDYPVRGVAAALGVNYIKDIRGNFSHSNVITVLQRDGSIDYQLKGLNADAKECVEAILIATTQR